MSDSMRRLREKVIERVLNGPGTVPAARRRAAYEKAFADEPARALLQKVAQHAWKVTREDVAAVRTAGVAEDEIYELVVCAALGQATRQLTSALAALDEAAAGVVPAVHPVDETKDGGG